MTTKKKPRTRIGKTRATPPGRATASTNQKAVGEYRDTLERHGFNPPGLASLRACLFLARHGEKFLIDFGFLNAVEKAKSLRRQLRNAQDKR